MNKTNKQIGMEIAKNIEVFQKQLKDKQKKTNKTELLKEK